MIQNGSPEPDVEFEKLNGENQSVFEDDVKI